MKQIKVSPKEQKERLLRAWKAYDLEKKVSRYTTGRTQKQINTLEDFKTTEIKKHLKDYVEQGEYKEEWSAEDNFEQALKIRSPFKSPASEVWKHYDADLNNIIKKLSAIREEMKEFNNFRTHSMVTGNYPNDEVIVIDNIQYYLDELFNNLMELEINRNETN